MAEYIEREAARTLFAGYGSTDQFDALLDTIPAADVVGVRHGRWIVFNDGTEESPQRDHMRCSVCGWYWSIPEHRTVFSHCPNCGAKMDGGVTDENSHT